MGAQVALERGGRRVEHPVAERLDEGLEVGARLLVGAAVENAAAAAVDPDRELGRQAGLADAGVAAEEDDLAGALSTRLAPEPVEALQLGGAADEGAAPAWQEPGRQRQLALLLLWSLGVGRLDGPARRPRAPAPPRRSHRAAGGAAPGSRPRGRCRAPRRAGSGARRRCAAPRPCCRRRPAPASGAGSPTRGTGPSGSAPARRARPPPARSRRGRSLPWRSSRARAGAAPRARGGPPRPRGRSKPARNGRPEMLSAMWAWTQASFQSAGLQRRRRRRRSPDRPPRCRSRCSRAGAARPRRAPPARREPRALAEAGELGAQGRRGVGGCRIRARSPRSARRDLPAGHGLGPGRRAGSAPACHGAQA